MIHQKISIVFNIHTPQTVGGVADMTVEQCELNYLKDHMIDVVQQAVWQFGEGSLSVSELRAYRALHFTIENLKSYHDAQQLEDILKSIANSLIEEIGA
tara:strand:- start:1241 stop:1537 length:297 start_codon:yes stop_codon:yes gene_type:complete